MKTITIPAQAEEINTLLEQARQEDVLVRASDGTEFMLTAVDDFDEEIARTRRSTKLMALLDERAKQTQTIPLDEVKRQLGLSS
jgi:acid stress-induced BolA-like protein IbaG/YrbA